MSKKTFSEDEYFGSYGSYGGSTFKPAPRCYESHPPLEIPGYGVIYGGSCNSPVVKDADVYIGFDHGMKRGPNFPWEEQTIVEVFYPVQDRHAPQHPENFRKMVDWTLLQLSAGKKVHAGCIGGHGRTGTFLAALVAAAGNKDAVQYVREHYCKKAVESKAQVDFLMKHYGVAKAEGTDAFHKPSTPPKVTGIHAGSSGKQGWPYGTGQGSSGGKVSPKASAGVSKTVVPVSSKKNVWDGAVR